MALSTSAIPESWEPPASSRDITGYVLNLWPVGGRVWVGGQESLATSVLDGWYPGQVPSAPRDPQTCLGPCQASGSVAPWCLLRPLCPLSS